MNKSDVDKGLMMKQIAAAILSQDQLVFTYEHDGQVVVRFVTPICYDDPQTMVHCVQHLPADGFRWFKLDKILNFHRVISRDAFSSSYTKKPAATSDSSS